MPCIMILSPKIVVWHYIEFNRKVVVLWLHRHKTISDPASVLCDQYHYCDEETTLCEYVNHTIKCICKKGYIPKHNTDAKCQGKKILIVIPSAMLISFYLVNSRKTYKSCLSIHIVINKMVVLLNNLLFLTPFRH